MFPDIDPFSTREEQSIKLTEKPEMVQYVCCLESEFHRIYACMALKICRP